MGIEAKLPDTTVSIGKEDTKLSAIEASFCAEFCIESSLRDIETASRQALSAFEEVFGPEKVIFNTQLYGIEAIDALATYSEHPIYMLADSPLDDENFGDPDNPDVFRHFFCFSSKPSGIQDFRADLVRVADRLTGPPLVTTEVTALSVRISSSDQDSKLSPLALALHCNDNEWFKMSGRPFGTLFSEESWVQGVLKDLITQRVLDTDQYLSREMPILQWVEILEAAADQIVRTDDSPATRISPDLLHADFTHLSGEEYHKDFAAVLECVEGMAHAFAKSLIGDAETYWNRLENLKLLDDFISFVLKVRDQSERVEIHEIREPDPSGADRLNVPAFEVTLEGEKIGKITKFQRRRTVDDLDNSVIKVGTISQFVNFGKDCRTIAALLHERIFAE